ncbi:MAG: SAM-dependent methyltransferase [Bdellovibrionales bacterium]
MPLFVVATPIGNSEDFSLRALRLLREADLVVGEELKVLRQTLKAAGVQARATDVLNEHSDVKDIQQLVDQCRELTVVLVSDCGTPGFCDPGADLVSACRKAGVPVHGVPGASALMTLLSVAGVRVDEFLFAGFLPAKMEVREKRLRELAGEKRALILMETPYRCEKFVADLAATFATRLCVVGLNLTSDSERLISCLGRDLPRHGPFADCEPIALVMGVSQKK